jgi:pyroglutamyl-peptidase
MTDTSIKVLVSGFEPFGGSKLNPSQLLVNELSSIEIPGVEIVSIILPVEFDVATNLLLEKVRESNPDIVISFGQAEGRSAITPEKIAINLDDARIPDNGGDQRKNQAIAVDGPDGYFSTLPVEKMVEEIKSAGVASSLSLSAGAFVCNHIFYRLQHDLRTSGVKSGFIHLPLVPEQSNEFPAQPTMELDEMVQGAIAAIKAAVS